MTYYLISPKGREEIADWLKRRHKRAEMQNLEAWIQDAEEHVNRDTSLAHGTIEIPYFDAISGHVESLTLDGDCLTAHADDE